MSARPSLCSALLLAATLLACGEADDDTVRLVEVSSNGSERAYAHELVVVPWQ